MNTSTKDTTIEDEILTIFSPEDYTIGKNERMNAVTFLKKMGLPTHKTEEYRFTPITKHLQKNFNWNKSTASNTINSIASFAIKELDSIILVFVNGIFTPALSKYDNQSSRLKIKTLEEAFTTEIEIITQYFDKLVNSEADAFAAMNTAYWKEGIFIQVPENMIVDTPIQILHLNDSSTEQVISHTRMLVVIEKNSELSIIEKFDSIGSQPIFHTFTEEIVVKQSASLNYYKIQNDTGQVTQVTNTNIQQADASKVNTFTLTMNGVIIRNNFSITIDGENCESHFHGLYLLDGKSLVDNHTVVDHRKPNSFSNEMYKGIMDGNSKGVFNGKIYVRPYAQKTNAFQSNRNILMSESASVNTKPQLEIWADDVKCSHGCTTGQLDEEALFYLQSRGIPYNISKAMLLYAFALDVLASINNEVLKNYLDGLIAKRLHKSF